MSDVEKRLSAAGHTLPPAPKAAAAYIQHTRAGNLVFVAGQIPTRDGKPVLTGKCGKELTLVQAQEMARICALNAIAVLKEASGNLDKVRILRTQNYANCAPGFTDIHLAANGASELFNMAFGERGKHARTSIGMAELPLNVPFEVEVTAVIE
ncbi:MAG: hypothetical protein QOC71_2076 [Thermoplasmata archaeon]|jgi:enamine deaminase RidA (YjgF/YER057c/UK114 family)|nr:hypothetical protein [Thermoplasmata archaeon]